MNSLSLKEVLEAALDDRLGDINEASHIYDELGLDSMAAVAMVIEIQRRTRLKIPEDDIPQLLTVGDLRRYLLALSGESLNVTLH